jgi:hypothetical protein
VAQRVTRGALAGAGAANRLADFALHGGFVQMMAAHLSGCRVLIASAGRKEELPCEVAGGAAQLPSRGAGHRHPAGAGAHVALVQPLAVAELARRVADESGGEHGLRSSPPLPWRTTISRAARQRP